MQPNLSVTKLPEGRFNIWFNYRDGEVYLRRSSRLFNNERFDTIDIANMSHHGREDNVSYDPHAESTGFLQALFNVIEDRTRDLGIKYIYVENVLNEWLPLWLEVRGYILYPKAQYPNVQGPPCFYKELK